MSLIQNICTLIIKVKKNEKNEINDGFVSINNYGYNRAIV